MDTKKPMSSRITPRGEWSGVYVKITIKALNKLTQFKPTRY